MRKKYEDLDFTSDFMFCKIMTSHKDLCIELLEIILGEKIRDVVYINNQEEIKELYNGKGVRLDVYLEEPDKVYNLEMQMHKDDNIPRRSRYYQGMIDSRLLDSGMVYSELKDSYVIFICIFDLFGCDMPVYRFENRCVDKTDLALNDGAYKIFLNAKGKTEGISDELKDFLTYLTSGTPEGELTERIKESPPKKRNLRRDVNDAVKSAKENEKWRREYMTLDMIRRMEYKEGMEKGMEQGRREGIEQGMEQGRKKAIEEKKSAIKKMISAGIERDIIISIYSEELYDQVVKGMQSEE